MLEAPGLHFGWSGGDFLKIFQCFLACLLEVVYPVLPPMFFINVILQTSAIPQTQTSATPTNISYPTNIGYPNTHKHRLSQQPVAIPRPSAIPANISYPCDICYPDKRYKPLPTKACLSADPFHVLLTLMIMIVTTTW